MYHPNGGCHNGLTAWHSGQTSVIQIQIRGVYQSRPINSPRQNDVSGQQPLALNAERTLCHGHHEISPCCFQVRTFSCYGAFDKDLQRSNFGWLGKKYSVIVNCGDLGETKIVLKTLHKTGEELKRIIEERCSLHRDEQKLWCYGREIKDDEFFCSVVGNDPLVVDVTVTIPATPLPLLGISFNILDAKFDKKFVNHFNNEVRFMRGGREYDKPWGWQRFGIKVSSKYPDSQWIGEYSTGRTKSSIEEWAVAYTWPAENNNLRRILEKGHRSDEFAPLSGKWILVSPYIRVAEVLTPTFDDNGNRFKVVIQNRVKPEVIEETFVKTGNAIHSCWLIKDTKDIRSYGFLVKSLQ